MPVTSLHSIIAFAGINLAIQDCVTLLLALRWIAALHLLLYGYESSTNKPRRIRVSAKEASKLECISQHCGFAASFYTLYESTISRKSSERPLNSRLISERPSTRSEVDTADSCIVDAFRLISTATVACSSAAVAT